MAKKPSSNSKKTQKDAKPPALRSFSKGGSALVDTRVIYCGDNLEQLKKLSYGCKDILDEQIAYKLA
ncbi:MAG: hypothetical protein ABSB91_01010 [Sedimentisphaerales bacterium]